MSPRPYVAWVGGGLRRYAVLEVRLFPKDGRWVGRATILSRHLTHRAAERRLHSINRSRGNTA